LTWKNIGRLYCRRRCGGRPRFRDLHLGGSLGADIDSKGGCFDKANVPAEQPSPQAQARLPRTDEDESRPGDTEGAPRQRPNEAVGLTRVPNRIPQELMRPAQSLSSGREFRRVIGHGRRAVRNGLMVFAARAMAEGPTRLGITVTKSAGTAVRRNRIKRRVRAACAAAGPPPGFEVVIRATPEAATMGFQELVDHTASALAGAGVRGHP
jgi:ribonuclease P protein component